MIVNKNFNTLIMRSFLIITILYLVQIANSQNTNDSISKSIDLVIYDGSDLLSMHQCNQNYVSGYRFFSDYLDKILKGKQYLYAKLLFSGLIGLPLTHEEGHRSVLTHKKIGSVSQPFFNNKGAAYVKGVSDKTLIELRDTDFPSFIRLHTAGIESDFCISNDIIELIAFEDESKKILYEELILRELSTIQYHLTALIPQIMPKLSEEANELDRDIVGHDIWGMIRHLYRPNMSFYRYTQFDDLTFEEKKYAKKLAYRSFTNLLNPLLYFERPNYLLSNSLKFNFSIGHSLSPFGDYYEQRFYLFFKNKIKTSIYFREFMNDKAIFWGTGLKINNYKLFKNIYSSFNLDYWNQPENFSFLTQKRFSGFSTNIMLKHNIINYSESRKSKIGYFLDIYYKTKGFLPGYASLDKGIGLRIGLSFKY